MAWPGLTWLAGWPGPGRAMTRPPLRSLSVARAAATRPLRQVSQSASTPEAEQERWSDVRPSASAHDAIQNVEAGSLGWVGFGQGTPARRITAPGREGPGPSQRLISDVLPSGANTNIASIIGSTVYGPALLPQTVQSARRQHRGQPSGACRVVLPGAPWSAVNHYGVGPTWTEDFNIGSISMIDKVGGPGSGLSLHRVSLVGICWLAACFRSPKEPARATEESTMSDVDSGVATTAQCSLVPAAPETLRKADFGANRSLTR
ncbi:hypothetical protein BP6252_07731 [Coleophoma cylindrospora]|uniref:Uncharacterized protein n=1 Tax=Coleophoma cylindrospora TaxID=1849047 RepID=A0A3D8RB69_9HELO|nr:hypothetical protein BP6252_07731 [Coleophoma cylindrospora]